MSPDDFESLGDALEDVKKHNAGLLATGRAKVEDHLVYRAFRQKYPQVSDDTMNRHYPLFRRLAEETDLCAPCLSLDRCKNWARGMRTKLTVTDQGYIYEYLTPCKNNHKGRLH